MPVKLNCGLEHGQPAQRTMSKVIFDGFSWVVDPSWSQSSQNGVPIVQLMFLYEARGRAPRTGTSSAQLGPHFWPLSVKSTIGTPFGPLSVCLEKTGPSKPKNLPGSKNITFFSCISLNQEHEQGWGGLGFHMIAGWQGWQR